MVVAGLGDSGEQRVVGQVGGFHRQGPWVAEQQCSSTCCGNHAAPRYVGGSPRRLMPELLDEIREFIEEEHGDKLHLTSHHPIRAQNFTTRSHSTAQVPCSCLGSTCSDVSSRPPCFEIFVMEGHISTISHKFLVLIAFFCARRINATRESLFKKLARRNNATSTFLVT